MRSRWILLAALAAGFAPVHAEVVIDEMATVETSPAEYYPQPSVPSIVFVSPEAREAGMTWLPSGTPFTPRPALLLPIQPQPGSPAAPGRLVPFNTSLAHPPASFMAAANLAAAHAYRSGAPGGTCPQDPLWSFRFGFGAVYPLGNNCWLNPYVPLVAAPAGFNQPGDRLPDAANAARQLERAHNYRFNR